MFDMDPIDCNTTNILTGSGDLWPESWVETDIDGVSLNTSCTDYSLLPRNVTPWYEVNWNQSDCPYPLVYVKRPKEETEPLCQIPCPDPTWTPHQWQTIANLQVGFATIAFVLMALLSIHYIADPKCRNSPKRFQLYSFLSQMLFALCFLVGGTDPIHNVWCKEPDTYSTLRTMPACGAQGVLFIMFGLSSSVWWAINSGSLYFQLTKKSV